MVFNNEDGFVLMKVFAQISNKCSSLIFLFMCSPNTPREIIVFLFHTRAAQNAFTFLELVHLITQYFFLSLKYITAHTCLKIESH